MRRRFRIVLEGTIDARSAETDLIPKEFKATARGEQVAVLAEWSDRAVDTFLNGMVLTRSELFVSGRIEHRRGKKRRVKSDG